MADLDVFIDLGQIMRLSRHQDQLAQLKRAIDRRVSEDASHRTEIGKLIDHCNQLKAALGVLVALLVERGVIAEAEAASLLPMTEPIDWEPSEVDAAVNGLMNVVDDRPTETDGPAEES